MFRQLDIDQLLQCPLQTAALPKPSTRLLELVRQFGIAVLSEIQVRPSPQGGQRFEVVSGVRLWQAAVYGQVMSLNVRVESYDDATARALLEIEALQHANREAQVNPIKRAQFLHDRVRQARAAGDRRYSLKNAGAEQGLSKFQTSHLMRLLALPQPLRDAVADGRLPARIARLLVTLPPGRQSELAGPFLIPRRLRIAKQPTAREIESRIAGGPKPPTWTASQGKELTDHFQAHTEILHREDGRGTVAIHYTSVDELSGLYERWHFKPKG